LFADDLLLRREFVQLPVFNSPMDDSVYRLMDKLLRRLLAEKFERGN
jgi:hypothetical protein